MKADGHPLIDVFWAALRAVDPERCVGHALRGWHPPSGGRLLLAGVGKAATAMARGAAATPFESGVLITKDGHRLGYAHPRVAVFEAAHPVPDRRAVEATGTLLELLDRAGRGDQVLFLLSGGGSALLELPAEGLSLDDLKVTNRSLLACGAAIEEVNIVRKHLSQVKGGRLARRIAPAMGLTLVLSDVLGNPLDAIASGPTVPDPTTFEAARQIVERYRVELPARVRAHLEAGADETPKPGDPVFAGMEHAVIADHQTMARAALERSLELGWPTVLEDVGLVGEAREVGRRLARAGSGGCRIYSGETTVTVTGAGRGGRCQELALAFAVECEGRPGVTLLAAASDGTDGPTDAAGALVDGQTCVRARRKGLDPGEYLRNNDSYAFFERLGEQFVTGPTGTNTNDLILLKIEEPWT
ncbi:MAG: glycerate kinase [Armatimonadetes bacterium]|nr:glycerate kinase [Armatimonadota bacterium]